MAGKEMISVVLPAYNEAESVEWVIDKTREALDSGGYNYEILLVDDASTDNTAELAEQKNVRVVRRARNQGSGAARKTGILEAKGEIIAMMDVDGSYDPADLPAMLAEIESYDMINGVREQERGTLKFLRVPTKWLLKKLAEFLSGQKIPDLNTGMKVFRKSVIKRYFWAIPDGFSCVTSMTLALVTNGHRLGYVPIRYHKRIGKSKFHPIKDTAKYLQTIVRLVIYFDPMKFFLPLSLGVFLIGVIKTIYDWFFVIQKMQLSDIVIILAGIMLFVLGIVSDLIVSQTKHFSHIVAQLSEQLPNREDQKP